MAKNIAYVNNSSVMRGTCKQLKSREEKVADRRRKALLERKRLKKEFRKYAKMLRIWREYKRSIRQKYGWLLAFLCEPWFLQFVLCVHWVLTCWISFTLRVNITTILEENCLRIIWNEWEAHCSNLRNRRTFAAHDKRPTGYRRSDHCTLDEQRAQQKRRWRLLMDPAFKKASERGARRRRARDEKLNVVLRKRAYRIASYRLAHSSLLPICVDSAKPRGGGLDSAPPVDVERATVRFMCFRCLLSTLEDESAAIHTQRIENEKNQVCEKCKLKNITYRPEGIYDALLGITPGQDKAVLVGEFSLWQASKTMLRDNELNIDHASSGICRIPVQEEHDMSIQLLRDKVCTRLPTNGNGKCGLHAVFGEPSACGELKVTNEAQLIRRVMPSDMVAMQNKLSERGKELLMKVTSGIWPQFVCPYLKNDPLTAEANIFMRFLQNERHSAVMQQCRLQHTANMNSQERKDFCEENTVPGHTQFF